LSFNEYSVRRLRVPADEGDLQSPRSLVVSAARARFGGRLRGVLHLGSYARGDAAAASDIDVLVVIDPNTLLTRDLYREWDREPLSFDGRAIDVHFIHPPAASGEPSAVWCEAAIDGHVWYDRGGLIARRLADARRAIADGRVVRAVAHGQPYWKGAA
jgi:predicted nucleotidyltransferase